MGPNTGQRLLRLPWLLFTALPWAAAQQTSPTNATLPVQSHNYDLTTSVVDNLSGFRIFPLTNDASLGAAQNKQGNLVLATTQSTGGVSSGDIAYVSCDPSAYPGNITPTQTIKNVVAQGPNALVLFSTNYSSCTYDASDSFPFDIVYTMIDNSIASEVHDALVQARSTSPASIAQSSSANNETSAGNPTFGGHSPTTAVAMIILYSITGIITALFLIIIIVGAIRAHRHPERYGPQTMLGRPRQSRARGIARAMLDTLPIVKFGEKEEPKPVEPADAQGRDIEMGDTHQETQPQQHIDHGHTRTSTEQKEDEAQQKVIKPEDKKNDESRADHPKDDSEQQGPEAVTTQTAPAISQVPAGEAQADANAENGLACSVCTDDFEHGQDIRVLPCNHKFHPECIDPWLLNVSGTCPLCRVDLRPTASNPDGSDHPEAMDDDNHDDNTISEDRLAVNRRSQRRSRTGLSLYIQHTLNRGRMRDATPEERVAALRRLRTVNRANDGESGGVINRLSARFSQALDERRFSSRRGSYAG